MLERNDKGKQVRRYFISIEEKYKEIAAKGHNVKQLTVTSRDVAKMLGKIHLATLNLIRECIGELQMQGFDTPQFFQESTYTSEKNREGIVQFLCTEEGCMCVANKLETDARQAFISEFTDRFERMRDMLEGRPVKRPRNAIEALTGQEAIRIYRSGQVGIISMCGEMYIARPDTAKLIENMLPNLDGVAAESIPGVVKAIIKSENGCNQMEMVNEYPLSGIHAPRGSAPMLSAPKVRLQTDKSVDLNNIENLTAIQAKSRYNIGNTN